MEKHTSVDFGAGWSPSDTLAKKTPKVNTKISFVDKFISAVEQKEYENIKQLLKDSQLQKSKVQKLAIATVVSHFDPTIYAITQKILELGLSNIFHAVKENPKLLLDNAVVTLIESEKTKKENTWFWDSSTSLYTGLYEDFLCEYLNGDHSVLPYLQKIQAIDPSVFNDISDLSQTLFAAMPPSNESLLLSFPTQSWTKTIKSLDGRASLITSEELQKFHDVLTLFPALHFNFKEFYSKSSNDHQSFLDFFETNIGYGSTKNCVLHSKMKSKSVHIVGQWDTFKSFQSLCADLLPYNSSIKKLGLEDAHALLYNFNWYHDNYKWVENKQEQTIVLNPQSPNYLSRLLSCGAPALELAFQTQNGIEAVEDCLKDNSTRAMFAMNAPLATVKTALSVIPSLKDMKDPFDNGVDHFMALRSEQNKQVVECVAQYFSNEKNTYGNTFGNLYEYIQPPNKASEYQKLLLKSAVKKDGDVLKKIRSRSPTKRKM